ncbi:MAG: hypothetical protein ACKVRN_11175 [Pyrinomonadaceae bacterium]
MSLLDETPQNPLARFEVRRVNYPMIIASVVLLVVLVTGIVVCLRSHNLIAAGIFLTSIAVFAALVLIYIAIDRRIAAVDDRKFINWDAAMPELQRQNANIEVREIARLLKANDEQIPDLLSAYIVAEDLALRQIQQEENLPLMRHVSIGKTPFDGILVNQDLITCIEISFLVVPYLRQEKIESMLKKMMQARKNLAEVKSRLRLRLMIVLVTQLKPDEEERLRGMLVSQRFSDTPVDIDIRMLDFETLQNLYLAE